MTDHQSSSTLEAEEDFYRNLIPSIRENRTGVEFGRQLLEFWRARLDDPADLIREDFVEYFLFQESIHRGLVSLTFFDAFEKKVNRHFGIFPEERAVEILNQHFEFPELAEAGEIFFEEQALSFKIFLRGGGGKECRILMVSAEPMDADYLAWFEKVLTGFFLEQCSERRPHVNNLYQRLKRELEAVIQKSLVEEVTFAYLRLENLKKYLNYAGDYFGYEVVHVTLNQIYANTSREDICYVIQPGQYLILCPGKTEEEVKENFRKINIKLKSLLLGYQIHYYSTKTPIDNMDIIWEELITGK